MPRKRPQLATWESTVDALNSQKTRYQLRRNENQTPYIKIEDRETGKRSSLKPLAHSRIEDVIKARELCEWLGEDDLNPDEPISVLLEKIEKGEDYVAGEVYTWDQLVAWSQDHLTKTMKESSARNNIGLIRNLANQDTPMTWKDIKSWLFQKSIDSRPFKNRLDALEQLRLAISSRIGDEPSFITRNNLMQLRARNNASTTKKTRYQPEGKISSVRAIPTKEQAEKYFDKYYEKYPLSIWCLIMMMCYGLRNHELWHIEQVEDNVSNPSLHGKFIYVPGNWRTKSFAHYVFPIYPEWIDKYYLLETLASNQEQLHSRAKPKIVSAKDMSKPWDKGDPHDKGVVVNNDYCGNWISKQLSKTLPEWKASVPNIRGDFNPTAKKEQIKPYDLRHTYAIRVSTLPEWNHISEADAALAMGHSIEVHRKNYQKWISEDQNKERFLNRVVSSFS